MSDDRRDDWHNSVDARLVNLTSAQKSTDDDLDELWKEIATFDRLLRGDPEENLEGLNAEVSAVKKEINKFNAMFNKDYLGHGGLESFITYLYHQEKSRQTERSYRWPFWGTVIAAVLGLAAVGLTHRDEIMKWFPKQSLSPFEQMIERARHPKNRYHHYTIKAPAEEDEP